ncbi:elongation factor P 5-aminopentanone reductase [Metabacillus arenae]|uniref:SDR family oxidoreductase n=1 Tax=Metabacillus arenae TaxID=2771434 RepID=A0A926NFY1_9BACI|nr:SDR family oxidoreductase [Metabacillus arenae]MBD1379283.1 SDR family oxidoreductase [Metabacillus arenae]
MNGKYALVTGASGGIGTAICEELAERGYHLFLHYYRNKNKAEELQIKLNAKNITSFLVDADLSSIDGVYHLQKQLHADIDVLILNSGTSYYGLITDMNDQEIDDMIQLHITSPFKLARQLLPRMVSKRAGSIVVISSIWGLSGASCEVLYSMVKGGQNSFVKALAKEVAPMNVRVNAIAPGAVKTSMLDTFSKEEISSLEEEIPIGRLAFPSEIADAVGFLVSDKSSYITGEILSVNGGWL